MRSRWVPTFSMMFVSLISYIDRNTLALLAPTILKETSLSAREYGFIISAFSIAYMLGNPVWGRILDRVGLRTGMSCAVSVWTLASAAHAFAAGFWSLGAMRAMLGFGEGATFPGGLRTVVQTLPPVLRSRGIAVAYSGGALGAVITPIIITPVTAMLGWRGAFWFTGFVGAAWLAVWLWISRRPDVRQSAAIEEPAAIPVRAGDARLWSFMAIYSLGALPLAFVLYGASLYLSRVLGKSQLEIGKVLWIPPLGWEVGYFFWGWVTDRFAAHGSSIPALRRLFVLLAILSLPLAATTQVDSYITTMLIMCASMFIAAGYVIGSMAYATSIFSAGNAGLIAGLGAGSWSALVAVVMPGFGQLFDWQRYQAAFTIASVVPMFGTLIWALMNRSADAAVTRHE